MLLYHADSRGFVLGGYVLGGGFCTTLSEERAVLGRLCMGGYVQSPDTDRSNWCAIFSLGGQRSRSSDVINLKKLLHV